MRIWEFKPKRPKCHLWESSCRLPEAWHKDSPARPHFKRFLQNFPKTQLCLLKELKKTGQATLKELWCLLG
jgi:hypothetical protein